MSYVFRVVKKGELGITLDEPEIFLTREEIILFTQRALATLENRCIQCGFQFRTTATAHFCTDNAKFECRWKSGK